MTGVALPAADYFNDPARTNAEAKDAQDATLAFLRQSVVGADAVSTLTIASGSVTPTGPIHAVDTEASASTDDLTNALLTNAVDGQLLVLTGANAGRISVVKHGAGGSGQFLLQDDTEYALDDENTIVFRLSGTSWVEVSRNNGAVISMFCGTAGGTANALTVNPNIAIPALRTGMLFTVIVNAANTSGSVTLNVQGLGAVNVKKGSGAGKVALGVGDFIAGYAAQFLYDGTDAVWMNPTPWSYGANVASSGTINLNAATGDYLHVTGTTSITAITLAQGQRRKVVFDGILTLTNGASLVLLSGANIITAAGDVAEFVGEASGVVRMAAYHRANGRALVVSSITAADMPNGTIIGRAYSALTTVTSVGTIPYDDTIPQSGEGTQLLSQAYTPSSSTARLRITVVVPIGWSSNVGATVALFNGSANDAIRAAGAYNYKNNGNGAAVITIVHEYVPGSTSPVTFTVRAGVNSGSAVVNGDSDGTSSLYGGSISAATIVIEEIKA